MDGYYTDGSVQDVGRDGHTVLVGGAGAWHANTNTHMGFTWAEYCPHVLPAELVASSTASADRILPRRTGTAAPPSPARTHHPDAHPARDAPPATLTPRGAPRGDSQTRPTKP